MSILDDAVIDVNQVCTSEQPGWALKSGWGFCLFFNSK